VDSTGETKEMTMKIAWNLKRSRENSWKNIKRKPDLVNQFLGNLIKLQPKQFLKNSPIVRVEKLIKSFHQFRIYPWTESNFGLKISDVVNDLKFSALKYQKIVALRGVVVDSSGL
jgi:hypothetical protein